MSLSNYRIDIDCLITWFPVRHGAALNVSQTRMDTFSYQVDDPPFTIGNLFGRFIAGDVSLQDGLDTGGFVRAITETGVDANQVFFMDLQVGVGRRVRTKRLSFEANTVTPFLINIRAAPGEAVELADTAATFQGVVTAGRRRAELVYQVARLVSRLVGFFPLATPRSPRLDSAPPPVLGTGPRTDSSTVDSDPAK